MTERSDLVVEVPELHPARGEERTRVAIGHRGFRRHAPMMPPARPAGAVPTFPAGRRRAGTYSGISV